MSHADTKKGSIEMIVAMVLSGTIGYFVVNSGQSFWNVVFFRCFIGAITLGLYAWFRGLLPRNMFHKGTLLLIIFGGLSLVGNWIFLFASFDYIPFSIATMAYHTQPLMLVLLSAALARQRVSLSVIFWLLVSFTGLLLVAELGPQQLLNNFATSDGMKGEVLGLLLGLLLALAAALLYTVTTLITKKIENVPPYLIALVQVSIGVVMVLPFVQFSQLPTTVMPWRDLIILGAVHTGFMYMIIYGAFQKLSTNLIAIFSFIYPVTALLVDYIAFSTTVSLWQGVGVLLILFSIAAVKFNWSFT